jgi:hypothetical protein
MVEKMQSQDDLLSELKQHSAALSEYVQRFFDSLQEPHFALYILLAISPFTFVGIAFYEQLYHSLSIGFKVGFTLALLSVYGLAAVLIAKWTRRVRSQVQAESRRCRNLVSRASELLEQSQLSVKEKIDLEAAIEEAESAIKQAEQTLKIGPRFARRYT